MHRLLALLLAMTSLPAQPPKASEAFATTDLTARLEAGNSNYLPFLSRPSLSCGLYRLAKGATDHQSPHRQDEIYYVLAGAAKLQVGDVTHDASAGSVLFVAAHAPHRFVEITEDLTTLVFFSNALPATGGMREGPPPNGQTAYHEGSQRNAARIFYWHQTDSAGQVTLDHGQPAWQASYEAFLTKPSARRWRFGENSWSTLDTNIPLTIGSTELAPGLYYLVLQNHPEHGPRLLALDPAPIRKQRLDAYEADKTEGGLAIPLTQTRVADTAPRLHVALEVDRAKANHATLRIRFGRHQLTADVTLRPE